jgi:hypothetical protein
MNGQKRRNPSQVDAWLDRLQDKSRALCPQFRPCALEELYPVRGHCVLSRSPGWFMIPSIEEYGRYCTSVEFIQCRWFRGTGETVGSVARQSG